MGIAVGILGAAIGGVIGTIIGTASTGKWLDDLLKDSNK